MIYRKRDKIKSIERLATIITRLKEKRKKVVFTNGCFDLIHVGHTRYLEAARRKGDCLIVAVNSDHSVARIKGNQRPLICLEERMEIVASFYFVDYVVSFDDLDPYRTIRILKPNVLVKGGDWAVDQIIGKDIVEIEGGSVLTIPEIKGNSTSAIIKKIIEQYQT